MDGDGSIGGGNVMDTLPIPLDDTLCKCQDPSVDLRINLVAKLDCESRVTERPGCGTSLLACDEDVLHEF